MLEITKESTVTPKLEKNSQVPEISKPTETPKSTKIPEDTAASVQILPALIQPIVSQKRKQIINWKKVKGADGYFVYASRCNDKKEIRKLQRIAIISSPGKTSYVNRNLKKNTGYKYEVREYRIRNGKKIVVGRSLQVHAFTKGNGLCNYTKWCNGKSQSDRKELNSDIAECKSIPLSFFLLYDERKRRVHWQWIE